MPFGEGGGAGAHDPVADVDAFGVGAKLGDFAGPFHAEHGADATGAAVNVALGHAEIGAVEAAGADTDQNLGAPRRRLGNIGDGGAAGAVDIGFHRVSFIKSVPAANHSLMVLFRRFAMGAGEHALEAVANDGLGLAHDP